MPNKEDSSTRRRMVVEEIEIPEKTSKVEVEKPIEAPKPDILDTGVKVSSQEFLQNENVHSIPQSVPEVKKQGSPVFWILIPGIFILGAILGGIIFYEKNVNSITEVVSPSPSATPIVAATPTSSPSANVNVAKYNVAVLNGSGTAGEAGKVKDLLTTAGFNVTSTGNAATYDYTKTIIKAKSTVDAAVSQKLKDAISKSYQVGDNQTLPSTATVDIQVIVGSLKTQ